MEGEGRDGRKGEGKRTDEKGMEGEGSDGEERGG